MECCSSELTLRSRLLRVSRWKCARICEFALSPGDPMKKFVLHLWTVVFVLVLSLAIAQHRPIYPHPPAPADLKPSPQATSGLGKSHLDGLQLQREARELSDLAKSIPLDIEQQSSSVNYSNATPQKPLPLSIESFRKDKVFRFFGGAGVTFTRRTARNPLSSNRRRFLRSRNCWHTVSPPRRAKSHCCRPIQTTISTSSTCGRSMAKPNKCTTMWRD